MTDDPTAPLTERTPEQIAEFIDNHIIMALDAAAYLHPERQDAEDYLRDRLVAVSDTWTTTEALRQEDRRRRTDRLMRAIRGK